MERGDNVRTGMEAVTISSQEVCCAGKQGVEAGVERNAGWRFLIIYKRGARACLCAAGDELVERERPIMQRREGTITGADCRRR